MISEIKYTAIGEEEKNAGNHQMRKAVACGRFFVLR